MSILAEDFFFKDIIQKKKGNFRRSYACADRDVVMHARTPAGSGNALSEIQDHGPPRTAYGLLRHLSFKPSRTLSDSVVREKKKERGKFLIYIIKKGKKIKYIIKIGKIFKYIIKKGKNSNT